MIDWTEEGEMGKVATGRVSGVIRGKGRIRQCLEEEGCSDQREWSLRIP